MAVVCTCGGRNSNGNNAADWHADNCPLNPNYRTDWNYTVWSVPGEKKPYAARTGWICPKCHVGISPDIDTCPCTKIKNSNIHPICAQESIEIKDATHS